MYQFTKQGDSGFHFQPITIADKEYADMYTAFLNDYAKIDNVASQATIIKEGDNLGPDLYFKVINDGKTVGLFHRLRVRGVCATGYAIEDVYVKPEFRGCGIATRIYQHAVHNYNCLAMSVSWQRVNTLTQIDAYRVAGFQGIMIQPGQVGTAQGLCMLVTSKLHTPLWFSLDKKGVVRASKHSQKICDKINRKYGNLPRSHIHKLESADWSVINTVIGNHFSNRMKLYAEKEEA
jgi:GNAT superfamily N-acetyltransferase